MSQVVMLNSKADTPYNNYKGVNSIVFERACKGHYWLVEYNKANFTSAQWFLIFSTVKACSGYATYFARHNNTVFISTNKRPHKYTILDITTNTQYNSMSSCSLALGYNSHKVAQWFWSNNYSMVTTPCGHRLSIV